MYEPSAVECCDLEVLDRPAASHVEACPSVDIGLEVVCGDQQDAVSVIAHGRRHRRKRESIPLAKNLTAEKKTEEFLPGKGVVTRWERVRKQNHWLDTLYNACAAGHYAGVRLLPPEPERPRISLSEIQRAQREHPPQFIDQDRWADMMRRHHG